MVLKTYLYSYVTDIISLDYQSWEPVRMCISSYFVPQSPKFLPLVQIKEDWLLGNFPTAIFLLLKCGCFDILWLTSRVALRTHRPWLLQQVELPPPLDMGCLTSHEAAFTKEKGAVRCLQSQPSPPCPYFSASTACKPRSPSIARDCWNIVFISSYATNRLLGDRVVIFLYSLSNLMTYIFMFITNYANKAYLREIFLLLCPGTWGFQVYFFW